MNLVILAGPPCSGKTTYLKSFHDYKIVSSDDEIALLDTKKYSRNKLNILGVKNSYKKINSYTNNGDDNIVYDSTNLTINRRKQIFENINIDYIKVINFISDFNNIYSNWEKRGKDMKIEMVLYFFIIFKKSSISEGFNSILDVKNIEKNSFKYLKEFLEGKSFEREKILEENKDLKVLEEFWKKGNKDFFDEYEKKLEYLEEMTLDDKLALFYSDIKYFYIDFIATIDITYILSYKDFLEGFIGNILNYKIDGMKLNKQKVLGSFNKLIEVF